MVIIIISMGNWCHTRCLSFLSDTLLRRVFLRMDGIILAFHGRRICCIGANGSINEVGVFCSNSFLVNTPKKI